MIVVALLIIPLFLIITTTQTKNDGSHTLSKEIPLVPIQKYNAISIDQEQLDLNHEVIQYKIIFHKDDTVNVSLNMIVQQTGIDFEPMYSFIMITDGNKSIFKNSTLFYTMDVPVGSIIDTNLFGKRICIGGKLFNRLLMKTRAHIGSACYYTENIKVKNNTIWYLTIAQLDNAHKEILTIAIKSKYKEMEIVEIERNKNMNFYSSYDNDFEGRYFGFRLLPYLPFGFSIAKMKTDNVRASFEFLTKNLKIPKENLAVSVFEGNKNAPKDISPRHTPLRNTARANAEPRPVEDASSRCVFTAVKCST